MFQNFMLNKKFTLLIIWLLGIGIGLPPLANNSHPTNDSILHIHQVEQMEQAYKNGQPLIDHWDPTIGLGYPFLRTYSHCYHFLLWVSSKILPMFSLNQINHFLILLIWSLWPLSLYFGLIKLNLKPEIALYSAFLAPLIHSSLRFGISVETYFGYGLAPNLLGLVFLPIALGLSWRYCIFRERPAVTLIFMVLTWFSHLMMGYILCISLAIFIAISTIEQITDALQIIVRFGCVCIFTLLASLFFLFPFLEDGELINKTGLESITYWDSYSITHIFSTFIKGDFLDYGLRIPIISILLLIGLLFPQKKKWWYNPYFWSFIFWLCMFCGRKSWNIFHYTLPLSDKISFERLVVACQFFAIVLSAHGLFYVISSCRKIDTRVLRDTVLYLLFFSFLAHIFFNLELNWITNQEKIKLIQETGRSDPSQEQLIKDIGRTSEDGSRLLVPFGISNHELEISALTLSNSIDHVGFQWHTMSHNSDFLYDLNWNRHDHLSLFAIKYTILPKNVKSPPHLKKLQHGSMFNLSSVSNYEGLFTFGQIESALNGPPSEHRMLIKDWMNSDHLRKKEFLGFNVMNSKVPINKTTHVKSNFSYQGPKVLEDGVFGYEINMSTDQSGFLIGKFTWHPGWTAKVDEVQVPTIMVSPSLTAIKIQPGTHDVVFHFEPSNRRIWLILLSFVCILLFPFIPLGKPKI